MKRLVPTESEVQFVGWGGSKVEYMGELSPTPATSALAASFPSKDQYPTVAFASTLSVLSWSNDAFSDPEARRRVYRLQREVYAVLLTKRHADDMRIWWVGMGSLMARRKILQMETVVELLPGNQMMRDVY